MPHKTSYKYIFLSNIMEETSISESYVNKVGNLPVFGAIFKYTGG
jgi:capsular polysaccharide biosynthesis protein